MTTLRSSPLVLPLAGIALALAACGAQDSAPRGPNVLIVTIDSLRADRLGTYGYARETSPNLDAFARESAVFERAYSHAPFTAPSHASLFTSLHTPSHGVYAWDESIDSGVPTYAERFHSAGWRTGAFYNHPSLGRSGVERGCDRVWKRAFGPADDTMAAFLDWVDEEREQPFAAWIHLWDVHRPYAYRDWRKDFFGKAELAVPRDELVYGEQRFGQGDPLVGRNESFYNLNELRRAEPKHTSSGERQLTDADYRYVSDRYDAGVAYADQGMRQLFAGLKKRGLDANTLVIVTADHGEALTERDPCYFTHDPFLYEETLHVPLIVRFPRGRFAGQREPGLVRAIDVLPTALEIAGLPLSRELQGKSLIGLLSGEDDQPRFLCAQTQTKSAKESGEKLVRPEDGASEEEKERYRESWLEHRQVWMEGHHKLLRNVNTADVHLYDLATDPGEQRDLASDPAWTARRDELVERLDRLLAVLPESQDVASPTPEEAAAIDAELSSLGYVNDETD